MITLDDVRAARQVGCTCNRVETRDLVNQDGEPVPGMTVTKRGWFCQQPAEWVNEWTDRGPDGRREQMLGAACATHHEQIVSGADPMLDSSHQLVAPDWYRLPADPAEDEKWVAELTAAADPEREGASDGQAAGTGD